MVKQLSKYRLLAYPGTYKDLADKGSAARLSADIKRLVAAINGTIVIPELDRPTNLVATGGSGYAVIKWDDVIDDSRKHLDGARIWRAAYRDDSNTKFSANDDKEILVNCIRTTKYTDREVVAGRYVYWVQWVNLEGVTTEVAGGVSATVT